jgi:hypothetical protein
VIIEVKGGVMRDKNFCKNLFFLVRTLVRTFFLPLLFVSLFFFKMFPCR